MSSNYGILRIPLKFLEQVNNIGDSNRKNFYVHLLFTSSIDGKVGPGLLGYIYLTLVRIKDMQLQRTSLSGNITRLIEDRIEKMKIMYINRVKDIIDKEINDEIFRNTLKLDPSEIKFKVYRLSPKVNIDFVKIKKEIDNHLEEYYKSLSQDHNETPKAFQSLIGLHAKLLVLTSWFSVLTLLDYGLLTSMTKLNLRIEREILEEYTDRLWEDIFRIGMALGYKSKWILSSIQFYPDVYSFGNISRKVVEKNEYTEWRCTAYDCWLSRYAPLIANIISGDIKEIVRLPALFMKTFWKTYYTRILGYNEKNVKVYVGYSNNYCRIRVLVSRVNRSSQAKTVSS